jgi:hypothetical protein
VHGRCLVSPPQLADSPASPDHCFGFCRYLLSATGLRLFPTCRPTGTDNAAKLSPASNPPRTGFPLSAPDFTVAYFGQHLRTRAATRKRQRPRRGPKRVAGAGPVCGLSRPGNPRNGRAFLAFRSSGAFIRRPWRFPSRVSDCDPRLQPPSERPQQRPRL